MNEYYGVPSTPMDDYLAHYGVRGMKWGVRKAIERGNDRKLSRAYAKAERKLAKLSLNADRNMQARIVSDERKKQAANRRVGVAGLAGGAGLAAGSIYSAGKKAYEMAKKTGIGVATANLTPALAAASVGAGALINKSIHKHRRHQAERRMTDEGHAKAVAERDAFKREMDAAFKGTKYGKGGKVASASYSKASNKSASNKPNNAERNLKRATYAGGLIGGLAYAGTHRKQLAAAQNKKRRRG